MKLNWFYIFIFILTGVLLFVTRKLYSGSSQAWVGVAEARDYIISSEKQASVKSVHVIQGQAIKSGDTLVQLYSLNLIQTIEKLENKIQVTKTEIEEKKKLSASEIELIKSAHAIDINNLDKEIQQAESELKLNREISSDLKMDSHEKRVSPLEQKISSLQEQIELRNKTTQIKIGDIITKSLAEQKLIQNQIDLMVNELAMLTKEKEGLIKIALTEGVVESVPIKAGDEVDAYVELISIMPNRPTSTIGYLPTKSTPPPIGSKVRIQSYDARWKTVEGKVIGYGTVTSLPEILQKATAVRSFGKEIFIEIPVHNEFSTGEKLLIRLWEE